MNVIDVLAADPELSELGRNIPGRGHLIDPLLFFRQFVAEAGIDDDQGIRGPDQQGVVAHLDAVAGIHRIALLPEDLRYRPEHGAAIQFEIAAGQPVYLDITNPERIHVLHPAFLEY